MKMRKASLSLLGAACLAVVAAAPHLAAAPVISGPFSFEPLTSSATIGAQPAAAPFVLPDGFTQEIIWQEANPAPDADDLPDMNTVNETGPQAGRYLYRTHEITSNGSVTVTDLETGQTRILAQRADWQRFDGLKWTPWRTLLAAEETANVPVGPLRDPQYPNAVHGLVYEIEPATGQATTRPALGSMAHEGIGVDPAGNVYIIDEFATGALYKFVPDRRGDLTSGQLYALQVTATTGDRTGEAVWLPLDREAVQVDSDAAAASVGATAYSRPEDVELAASTGNSHDGSNVLYVAITGEDRVLAIALREPAGGAAHAPAFVTDYVRAGVNAPADFDSPDNLALDHSGNLYISEDPGGSFAKGKTLGDDIWVATPGAGNSGRAGDTVRFASLTDCDAEPTGIYFSLDGSVLYVNVQHRGADGADLAVAIRKAAPPAAGSRD